MSDDYDLARLVLHRGCSRDDDVIAVSVGQCSDEDRRVRGERVAALGVSPGFRDLQWLKPVYVGDTVAYSTEVIEMRPLASRPGWGVVSWRNTGVNQRGEPVISFISSAFVERESKAGAP